MADRLFFWGPEPIKSIMAHYAIDTDDHRNMVEATVAQLNVVVWLCSVRWWWPLHAEGRARRVARAVLADWMDARSEVATDDLWDWCDALADAVSVVLSRNPTEEGR